MSRQTVSIFCELPGGRPSRIPLSFFTAKASFVLCDIRVLSISAARAKAKAMIFELIFSERSKLSFMEWIDMPLSAQRLRIDIIISIFLPRRVKLINYSSSTADWNTLFSTTDSNYSYGYYAGLTSSETVSITDGRVTLDGVDTHSGYKADAIEFTYTRTTDDGSGSPATVTYYVRGMKNTGWEEDMADYTDFIDNVLLQ